MTDQPPAPAGWYPLPDGSQGYWDGQQWTTPPTHPAPALSASGTNPGGGKPIGFALTALITGIVAFLTGLAPWVGLVFGAAAIAFGIVATVRKQSKGMAITGLVLGALAFLSSAVATVSFTAFLANPPIVVADDDQSPTSDSATPSPTSSSESEVSTAPPQDEGAELGSVANPYPQPYTAMGLFGGEKYALTARIVDANANSLVSDWSAFNTEAPSGYKWVVVELTMTGLDPDGIEPALAEFDLFLATDEGNRYSSEYIILGDGMASMSDAPTVYPGSSFTGYTAYRVPETAQTFYIYDNGNYVAF